MVQELRNKDLMICVSDKGRGFVVLNLGTYSRVGSELQPFVAVSRAAKVPLWSSFGAIKFIFWSSSEAEKAEFCSSRSKFWSWPAKRLTRAYQFSK